MRRTSVRTAKKRRHNVGVVVQFNYANWIALFPEFASIPQATVTDEYFPLATVFHRNDGGGPVPTAALQSSYLNMMTAHIAALLGTVNGVASSTIVGRIASASEGSVSVSADFPLSNPSQAWYATTKYGAMYYQATRPYRTIRYRIKGCGLYGGNYNGTPWVLPNY